MEAESYSHLFLNEDLSDFRVIVEEDETTKCIFPVHSLVLKRQCPIFRTMLESDFVEGQKREIVITDFKAFHVKLFLEFLYTNTLPEIHLSTDNTLCELARLANRYMIEHLQDICEKALSDMVTLPSVYTMLAATSTGMPYLKEKRERCLSLLKRAAFKLLKCDEAECLEEQFLELLLSADNLNIREMEAFEVIWRWGTAKVRFSGSQVCNENVVQCIQDLLKHVRWSLLGSQDQAKIISLGITVPETYLQKSWRSRKPSTTDIPWFLNQCDVLRVDSTTTSMSNLRYEVQYDEVDLLHTPYVQSILCAASLTNSPFYVVGVLLACMHPNRGQLRVTCECQSSYSKAEIPVMFPSVNFAQSLYDDPETYNYQELMFEFPKPIQVCKDQKLTIKIEGGNRYNFEPMKVEGKIIESNKGRRVFVDGVVSGIRQIYLL